MIDLNNFQSINMSRFSQLSIWIRIRISFLVILHDEVMFDMLMVLIKFSFVPQHFFRIRIRIPLAKSIKKRMLCVLKIPTKFGVIPQSFFQNQNPVQDEDQDQDHDFTLDFNTRPTDYSFTWKYGKNLQRSEEKFIFLCCIGVTTTIFSRNIPQKLCPCTKLIFNVLCRSGIIYTAGNKLWLTRMQEPKEEKSLELHSSA